MRHLASLLAGADASKLTAGGRYSHGTVTYRVALSKMNVRSDHC